MQTLPFHKWGEEDPRKPSDSPEVTEKPALLFHMPQSFSQRPHVYLTLVPHVALGPCRRQHRFWLLQKLMTKAHPCTLGCELRPETFAASNRPSPDTHDWLGSFRFPWAWILVTSPSLPGLPVDLLQGKGKAGRGCWQAAGISGAPQPQCPATLDLQASDHIPVKWQKPQQPPHRLPSQWDGISRARAKCALVWIHWVPSSSSLRGPRLVGYKTGGLRFRRCACRPRQCPLFLRVHEQSPPHWASVSPIRK